MYRFFNARLPMYDAMKQWIKSAALFSLWILSLNLAQAANPIVSVTAPANNSTYTAPTNILIQASASDPDGSVSRVEFFRSGTKIGEDLSGPTWTLNWTNALVGTFQLTAIATDNLGGSTVSAPISVTFTGAAPVTLIAPGSVWRYLDTGDNLTGTLWNTPGFNDGAWLSGPAELGYGDGGEATLVRGTNLLGERIITTYFRHPLNVANPSLFSFLQMQLRRDDGGIVYVNGTEVFRSNIPPGPVDHLTLAQNAGDDGNVFFTNNAPANLLLAGNNVVAVEIHQTSTSSSDISFDFELIGNTGAIVNNPPTVTIISPGGGSAFTEPANIAIDVNASDSDGSVSKVEFFANGGKIGEDTASPFSFGWNGVLVGSYALRAVATDNLGFSSTSAVVNVTVGVASVPTVAGKVPRPAMCPASPESR
jgi:hypothetical protein